MSSKIEHPFAYYVDSAGTRCRINADKLKDRAVRIQAEENDLTDITGQTKLSPRVWDGAVPHFVANGVRGTRKVFEGERDPKHDARVNELLSALNTKQLWKLGLGDATSKDQKLTWSLKDPLTLPNFNWGNEVYRIIEKNAIVRHDLFGQASRLDMSIGEPCVAIEVIHTHFPEEEAFSAMLQLSERIPFYVLFDVTAAPNKFVRIEPSANGIIFRDWTYLIHDGSVWKGEKRQASITTSAALKVCILEQLKKWNLKLAP